MNIGAHRRIVRRMKQIAPILALAVALALPGVARAADCYADYKAKQDSPLRLHYGVMKLSGACDSEAARTELSARLAQNGWILLDLLSVFGPDGLQERKADAGSYYLRF